MCSSSSVCKKSAFLLCRFLALGSMRSRVYVAVRCPSVCLSVRLSDPSWAYSSQPATAGLLLWARRAGDISRLLHNWRSAAAACIGRMRAVPRCQRTWVAEHGLVM